MASQKITSKNIKQGKWNGEKCEVELGTVICGESPPTWWCSKLKGQRLKCVKVKYCNQTFFLFDGDGSGSHKVFETMGGPFDAGHKSIPVDDITTFKLNKDS